jgi:protease IV
MNDNPSFTASPPTPGAGNNNRSAAWALGGVTLGIVLPGLMCACLAFATLAGLGAAGSGANNTSSLNAAGNSVGPEYVSGPATGDAIAIVEVNGAIVSGDAGTGGFGGASGVAASGPIVRAINAAARDRSVKAILLKVDSPGGSVIGSDEIYNALKKSGKPVVAYMGALAASGGYYVSMGASHIMAHPDSLTGSIGVISEFTNLEGLYEKVGAQSVIIKSGENKDFGASTVPFTDQDRALWQAVIDETYDSFVTIIADNRGMTKDEVKKLADGRVYTGRQALALKLIDGLGYADDAIQKTADLGGITGEPRVLRFRRQQPFAELFGISVARTLMQWTGIPEVGRAGPQLEYR